MSGIILQLPQCQLGHLSGLLEMEMATHSSVLAWRIPGMGESGRLPSMGSQSRTWLKRLSSSSSSGLPSYVSYKFPNRMNFSCAKWILSWLCTLFPPSPHFNLTFLAPLIVCHGLMSSINNLNSSLSLGVISWRNLNCDSDYFGRFILNFQLECLLLLGKQVMRWVRIPTVQTLGSFSHKW